MFGFTRASAVEDKDKEIAQVKKDFYTELQHKEEIQRMKDVQRGETKTLKEQILEADVRFERKENEVTNLLAQLEYEKSNRQPIIEAEVQKQLGQYETRYYHDLHTFIEGHSEKTQDRMMKYMENTLQAIKELKPVEPKVMILGKEVFGADAKAQQNEKKQN